MNRETIITMYRRFRAWQQWPFRYAMNEDDVHRCHNCGREYVGNFCPQCGQKATLGTVNWSSVRENVMEIWGVGTRSMTYTLWQLLWRPGYLIRDYISGRRQVSFPPVKMLLIVAIVCTLIDNQLGGSGHEKVESAKGMDALFAFIRWAEQNRGWGFLAFYSTMILPTWALFRHAPRCTAHTLPQGFFIQVFLCTLAIVFTTLSGLAAYISWLVPIYFVIAYHQLFGCGLWGTLWRLVLCGLAAASIILTMVFLAIDIDELSKGDNPAWLIQLVGVSIFGLSCVVILAVGYAIGKRTQKRKKT